MRGLRLLLPVVIVALVAVVARLYHVQRTIEQRQSPAKPQPLPPGITAKGGPWEWVQENEHGIAVRLRAGGIRETKDPPQLLLDNVEVELHSQDGLTLDRFLTGHAVLDQAAGTLLAEGDVQIMTGEPARPDAPGGRRVYIRTAGVTLETKTGRASTDRPSSFVFEQGEGQSVGAWYDPNTRELDMRSDVRVLWRGADGKAAPLEIEAGEAMYKEKDSLILLWPWCRLKRGDLTVEGTRAGVYLNEGVVERVEAYEAHGVHRPKKARPAEFSAGALFVFLTRGGEVAKIEGMDKTRLVSEDGGIRTTVTGERTEMQFETAAGESQLKLAYTRGGARLESRATSAQTRRETRVLHSEHIEMRMRPGGREIERVVTQGPGVIEFLPVLPQHRSRRLEAAQIEALYGPKNEIQRLLAKQASTRTEYPKPAKGPAQPPMLTWSRELAAEFDPERSELARMEQTGDFRFEQGDRKGWAEKAVLDAKTSLITLEGKARTLDPGGSLAAARIRLDQEKGDVTAEGQVESMRLPERGNRPTAVLTDSEPYQARADRMVAPGDRTVVRYEGNVVLWQGGNRIEAAWVEIDRRKRVLTAGGNVVSRLLEQPAGAEKRPPVLTVVRAQELRYTDENRTAVYTGGVEMDRAGLTVTSDQLRAVFALKDGRTELEAAYADGRVNVVEKSPQRTRQGKGEHAEYYVADAKAVLYGGSPEFEDTLRGATRGTRITWYQEKDALVVEGGEAKPSASRLRR